MADPKRVAELAEQMKHLSPEEKEKIRNEKLAELEDLKNFKNITHDSESNYREMSMEEFENHPLFMDPNHLYTQDEIDDNEFLQQMQAMKYNNDGDTLDEKAEAYKSDGTFHFKCKLYKKACLAYSKAITINPPDQQLLGQCYNNRAAAHFFRGNMRQAIQDSGMAIKIDRNYFKAWLRIFQACEKLDRFKEGLEMVNKAFELTSDRSKEMNEKFIQFREKFTKKSKEIEKLERKQKREDAIKKAQEKKLVDSIIASGVTLDIPEEDKKQDDYNEESANVVKAIETNHPSGCRVHLSGGILTWPVTFVYPEHTTSDFIEKFAENVTIYEMISLMFEERPTWDNEGKYTVDNVNIWTENRTLEKLIKVDLGAPLNSALRMKNVVVYGGCPNLIVTARGSPFEKHFLGKYDRLK